MSADYSQIEVRMMAHLSQDESLTRLFMNEDGIQDVYMLLGSKIFGEPFEKVSYEQRSHAKTLCLALIYGLVSI